MTVVQEDAGARIAREYRRGPFAWWDAAHEAEFHEKSGVAPDGIVFRVNDGWPSRCQVRPSQYAMQMRTSDYGTWDASLAAGKSYLVGDSWSMEAFIAKHRSTLRGWQPAAYEWARQNPYWKLCFTIGHRDWEVYACDAFVTFALPHQDAGGERHYISRDGKTKVLVNVD